MISLASIKTAKPQPDSANVDKPQLDRHEQPSFDQTDSARLAVPEQV